MRAANSSSCSFSMYVHYVHLVFLGDFICTCLSCATFLVRWNNVFAQLDTLLINLHVKRVHMWQTLFRPVRIRKQEV